MISSTGQSNGYSTQVTVRPVGLLVKFRILNIRMFNASSKSESQIVSYKQDTKFGILCFAINWYLVHFDKH